MSLGHPGGEVGGAEEARFEDLFGVESQAVEAPDEGRLVVDLDAVAEAAADLEEPSSLDGQPRFLADFAGDRVLVPLALIGVAGGESPIGVRRARAGGAAAGRARLRRERLR